MHSEGETIALNFGPDFVYLPPGYDPLEQRKRHTVRGAPAVRVPP
jgi:hypothetical protein